jgi:hypothetical protein
VRKSNRTRQNHLRVRPEIHSTVEFIDHKESERATRRVFFLSIKFGSCTKERGNRNRGPPHVKQNSFLLKKMMTQPLFFSYWFNDDGTNSKKREKKLLVFFSPKPLRSQVLSVIQSTTSSGSTTSFLVHGGPFFLSFYKEFFLLLCVFLIAGFRVRMKIESVTMFTLFGCSNDPTQLLCTIF